MSTKIIATIGPGSDSPEIIRDMIVAGMDVARLNFVHCTQAFYTRTQDNLAYALKGLKKVRGAAKHLDKVIKVQQELRGPSIRVGKMPEGGRELKDGEEVIFSTRLQDKDSSKFIFVDDPNLHLDMKVHEPIYLVNGLMELVVTLVKKASQHIYARVVRGGVLHSNKTVNVPQTQLTTSGLTQKDREDVAFALREGVDYIALSFVQCAQDVLDLRKIVKEKVKIIAKIESAIALHHIDAILKVSDAVMIARGDLGVEVPAEEVPFIQKNIIRHAAWLGKPSIVGTQILTSMLTNPYPTRAEVSDIANAVWDGANALMVSDETAIGKYPVEVVKTLKRVIDRAIHYHSHRPFLL